MTTRSVFLSCCAALLLLGGCSIVRLSYDNAESISYWWLDSYFDFSDGQAEQVRADLQRIHEWHRSTQLGEYADILASIRGRTPDEVTPESVEKDIDRVRAEVEAFAYYVVPYEAGIARQLEPAQIVHLKKKFAEVDKEWRKKWITAPPDEVAEQRYDVWLDWAESFYGDLNDGQKAYIKAAIARSAFDAQVTWEQRQRRQEDILATLDRIARTGLDQAGAEAEMKGLVERSLNAKDPAYEAMLQKVVEETCVNLAGLHKLTSRAQRLRAQEKLGAYERELRALINRP